MCERQRGKKEKVCVCVYHSGQMPELPQLAPFNVGERQLYSELLPNGQAPHLIPNVELGHPSEEAH